MSLPMRLVHIRSQLQYLSPSEFNNLTVAELKDPRFTLVQRIYLELLTSLPRLKDQDAYKRCFELVDKRKHALKYLKREEERKDVEYDFKHQFMLSIERILVLLEWPPACEPFADVLNPLMKDPSYVLTSIEFMLTCALALPNTSCTNATSNSTPTFNRDKPSTPSSGPTSTPRSAKDVAPLKAVSSSARRSSDAPLSRNNLAEDAGSYSSGKESFKSEAALNEAYSSLKQSFKILQNHNEMLTSQLGTIMDSVGVRDEYESRMESLLNGLVQATKEQDGKHNACSSLGQLSSTMSQWTQIRRDMKRQLVGEIEIDAASVKHLRTSESQSSSRRNIRLSQILGKGSIALDRSERENHGVVNYNERVIDLKQVHALQRDLIGLCDTIVSSADLIASLALAETLQPETLVVTQRNISYLTSSTCDLLIRLSAYAPVAALDESPEGSTLMALIEDVHRLSGQKGISQSCQSNIDRCITEQQTLLRCYDLRGSCLYQWSQMFQKLSRRIEKYGEETLKVIDRYLQDAQIMESSLLCVTLALDDAESDRIEDGKRGTRISPLDALSRGIMGASTGNLVNALRMQAPTIRNVVITLKELQRVCTAELDKERQSWNVVVESIVSGREKSDEIASGTQTELNGVKSSTDYEERSTRSRRRSSDSSFRTAVVSNRPAWNS